MDGILYHAVERGDASILGDMTPALLRAQVTPDNNTLLHLAALFGQSKCVKVLYNMCGKRLLVSRNNCGETALHIAAMRGHYSVAKLLIGISWDVVHDTQYFIRIKDVDGNTALHNAVRAPCYDNSLFSLLLSHDLEHGQNPPNNLGESVLFIAAEQRKPEVVSEILTQCPYSSHSGGPNGRNALHAAVISLDGESVQLICNWKLSLAKEADAYGWSPIHYAAVLGESSILTMLVGMDISLVSTVNVNGDTPIHIAAGKGRLNIVKYLLGYYPACWDCRNNKRQNILHVALENEQMEVVEYLSKHKLFHTIIYQKDNEGNTPLHLAAQKPKSNLFNHVDIRDREAKVFNHNNVTPTEIFSQAKLAPFVGWRNDFMMHKLDRQASEVQNFVVGYGKMAQTQLVVSSVIAAVTFAAGFTVPGGLNSVTGHPVLRKETNFQIFVLCDTIALLCSLLAMFILMISVTHKDNKKIACHQEWAFHLMYVAMFAMVMAFLIGLVLILNPPLTAFIGLSCGAFVVIASIFFFNSQISAMKTT